MLNSGERQVAESIDDIRRDHVARYEWAVDQALNVMPNGSRVLDIGCGVGYGSYIMAHAGFRVDAIDCDEQAISYANLHYKHNNINYHCNDVEFAYSWLTDTFDVVTAFEIIEHLENPLPMLEALHHCAKRLFASVPNETAFPFKGYKFHHRHYTAGQLNDLLSAAGWSVVRWWGQLGTESNLDVCNVHNDRTLIVECARMATGGAVKTKPYIVGESLLTTIHKALEVTQAPKHVAILGMGPSLEVYMDLCRRLGGRRQVADETWAINALGDTFACDRIFHMDDVRVQEIRAAAAPESNIANMLKWVKTHPGPIYTSRVHPDYPGLVEYPFADVQNDLGVAYFNSTAAWTVAYAIHLGIERISLYGCDFTFQDAHKAEKGRGCLEFWLGFAKARGIAIRLPQTTSLMDACEPQSKRYYGYDLVEVHRLPDDEDGNKRWEFKNRPVLPTAAEIEAAYDHEAHPNPLIKE